MSNLVDGSINYFLQTLQITNFLGTNPDQFKVFNFRKFLFGQNVDLKFENL